MYELTPYNGRASFYAKALVDIDGNNKKLYSYGTLVASIDGDKNIHRHWDCEKPSTTTMSHIKSFIAEELGELAGEKFNAKKYMELPCEEYGSSMKSFGKNDVDVAKGNKQKGQEK